MLYRVPVSGGGSGTTPLSDAAPQPAFGLGGPVAVTDRLAVLNATATLTMTLAAPTVDGQPMTIKRRGIGGFSLTLTLDDVAGKVLSGTGGSTAPKDVINLIGVISEHSAGSAAISQDAFA